METKLKTTFNGSPRKVRLVVDLIRNKPTHDAINILSFTEKRAAKNLKKLLYTGINNAINNFAMDIHKLYVKSISVDEGKKTKRLLPGCKGRVYFQFRRSSIVNLTLAEKEDQLKKVSKKTAPSKLDKESDSVNLKEEKVLPLKKTASNKKEKTSDSKEKVLTKVQKDPQPKQKAKIVEAKVEPKPKTANKTKKDSLNSINNQNKNKTNPLKHGK
ncbi:50S ribosomal protein L22 [Mycoplasma sp. SG1]|uniref:50S ribosomal protein L22 n=1 Tax=Mycoplasma sp. SG1 TaxID=2810348 RepID=UPI0020246348|nr:50S ribosomal protein L22 [Mycoplasma sp. SG1]URM52896.1 50S ribosomal protein L22 [Mycoplasma sp. SG1]